MQIWLLLVLVLMLTACGGGSGDSAGGDIPGSEATDTSGGGVDSTTKAALGVYLQQHEPSGFSEAVTKAAAMGITEVRLTFSWNLMEPSSGEFDAGEMGSLMARLSELKNANMRAIVLFARTPCWAADTSLAEGCVNAGEQAYTWGPPQPGSGFYGDFLRHVVGELRAANLLGTIRGWEIWNEVNVPYFWGVDEYADNPDMVVRSSQGVATKRLDVCTPSATTEEGCQHLFVPEYMPLLLEANQSLKQAYAGSGTSPWVLGFSISGMDIAYFEEVYRYLRDQSQGRPASDYFDAIAIHPYSNNMPLDYRGNLYSSMGSGIQRILDLMSANGDAEKPLYFTEFAWSNYDGQSLTEPGVLMGFPGVAQATQVAYLQQLMEKINGDWKDRVTGLIWSGITDDAEVLTDIEGHLELDNEASFFYQGLYAGADIGTAAPRALVDYIARYNTGGEGILTESLSLPQNIPLHVYREAGIWSFPSGKTSNYSVSSTALPEGLLAVDAATPETWTLIRTAAGYRLHSDLDTVHCLGSLASGETYYDKAGMQPCDNPDTEWNVYPFLPGVVLQNVQSGRCLSYNQEYFGDVLVVEVCDKYKHGQIFRVQ